MKNFFPAVALLSFTLAQSQNLLPEREAFLLKIPRNAKQSFIQEIGRTPYLIEDKTLQIYPHERINLEFEIKADTIFSMATVAKNLNPERTVEIEFCQTVENNKARPVFFLKNPFGKKLTYNLIVYDVEESQWQTTAKTANPNWTSRQAWGKVISSLVFKDWKLEAVKPKN